MSWRLMSRIAGFATPWFELVGERWMDDLGAPLDYWRVIAADSVIIITMHAGAFLLPMPMFRPGVGQRTLDFPGGRLPSCTEPRAAAVEILARELGVKMEMIEDLEPLTVKPLLVNSSFSSQKLHGFLATLEPSLDRAMLAPHRAFPADAGARDLFAELDCLQCRGLLFEALSRLAM